MPTPLPVLAGVYYGRVEGQYEGLPCGNIFTWRVDPAPGTTALDDGFAQDIANAMRDNWTTTMVSIMLSIYTGGTTSVYPLGDPASPARTATGTWTGGALTAISTTATAAVIKHSVLRRGKGTQSRTYISPVGTSQISSDGKSVSSTFQTSLDTQFNLFVGGVISDFTTANPGHGLTYGQLSKKGTGAFYEIVTSSAELPLSTQRRRTRRA